MNTLAYIIYLLLTYLITVHVGLRFFHNGRIYILTLLEGDEEITDSINKILLVGYYLLNLGYAAIMIRFWKTVNTWPETIASIATMTGRILLTLAIIHFFNMATIYWIGKHRHQLFHHKN